MNSVIINVLKEFCKIKSLRSAKVLSFVLENICVEEQEIAVKFKLSFKYLQKCVSDLLYMNFVKRVRSRENVVYVIIHKRFYDPDFTDSYSIKFKQVSDLISRETASIDSVESLRGNIIENNTVDKKIKDWRVRDFTCFFLNYYEEKCFDHIFKPNKLFVSRKMIEALKKFKSKYGLERHKILLKQYVKWWLNSCAVAKSLPRIDNFLFVNSVNNFCKQKGIRIFSMEICSSKEIYCPYFEKERCSLGDSNMICSKRFFEKMKEKYN